MKETTIRNSSLFCLNCGGTKPIPEGIIINDFCTMANKFDEHHKNCEKTWHEPDLTKIKDIKERIANWLLLGETGKSSLVMAKTLLPEFPASSEIGSDHPCDPDDFGRCYKFLEAFPEVAKDLIKMRNVSVKWFGLIENWAVLTDMYIFNHKGMYNHMRHIIDNSFSFKINEE